MLTYFDSSVALEFLLGQPSRDEALELWGKRDRRVTSVLFEIECRNVIRRANAPKRIATRIQSELAGLLEETAVLELSGPVLERLRGDPRLSEVRTLDSIHLATALVAASASDELELATFDRTLGAAARRLGIRVVGMS